MWLINSTKVGFIMSCIVLWLTKVECFVRQFSFYFNYLAFSKIIKSISCKLICTINNKYSEIY